MKGTRVTHRPPSRASSASFDPWLARFRFEVRWFASVNCSSSPASSREVTRSRPFLADHEVLVNGEPDRRRGRHLQPGDVVRVADEKLHVTAAS